MEGDAAEGVAVERLMRDGEGRRLGGRKEDGVRSERSRRRRDVGANLCSRVLSEEGWGEGADTVACLSSTPTYLSRDVSKAALRSPRYDLRTTTDVLREVKREDLRDIYHVIYFAVD